jgi:hypothetical protein
MVKRHVSRLMSEWVGLEDYRQNPLHQGGDCAASQPVPTLLAHSSHILVGRK